MTQRRSAQTANEQTDLPPRQAVGEGPVLQPPLQDHIGRQLRALYDDVLAQPVPDRFKELMDRLDRVAEGKK